MNDSPAERLRRIAGKQTLRLTHIGRKSGKAHQATIWFTTDGEKVFLVTENVARNWVQNVKKTPQVKLSVGGEIFEGLARFVDNREEHERMMARMRDKYWIARPLYAAGRVLTALGWVTDRSGSFEITLKP